MTRDPLVRVLLWLAIAFVGLQIAAVLFVVGSFVWIALGGDPLFWSGGSDFDFDFRTEGLPR
jgi:hypothetical protein